MGADLSKMTPQILGTSRRRKSNISRGPDLIDRINNAVDTEEEKPAPDKSKDLSGKLQRSKIGKPKLKLKHLEKTAVHTPTPEGYDLLMQVYECGGLNGNGIEPTKFGNWIVHKEKTCLHISNVFFRANEEYYQEEGYNIISPQKFYNQQNITPEMIKEINAWFEINKPNRESKG
jgi:hypothetical protein